ncbi:hypothetical protein JOQ06_024396, partial [Pogonophryne albipinna]
MDPPQGQERRGPVTPASSSRYHRRRSSGSRDERYRSDVHTEAVQAALAKHKERKLAVPMPSKRRSLVVQNSMDAYTPPGTETYKHLFSRANINHCVYFPCVKRNDSSAVKFIYSRFDASFQDPPLCSSHAGLLAHLSLRKRRRRVENAN